MEDKIKFIIDAEAWKEFVAFLDAPVRDLPRMRALLAAQSVFDTPPGDLAKEAP